MVSTGSRGSAPPPGEFDLIARYFAPLAKSFPGALGLKDDVALIDVPAGRRIVVTVDAMVAGVHFLPDDPPDAVARKLMRVNLSDLAAKGAEPYACLMALSLPAQADDSWLQAFAGGLAADAAEFAMPLIGGDTTATPGPLTVSLTAFGLVGDGTGAEPGPMLRSGAKVGDRIFVSGTIGDGLLGLRVSGGDHGDLAERLKAYLVGRYRLPNPRLALGRRLAAIAHASADVSDGLVADLGHICAASGVGAEIQAAMIPMSDAAQIVVARTPALLSNLLSGGDDYELVFAADPADSGRIAAIAQETGVPVTGIGFIVAGDKVEVTDARAMNIVLETAGYRHF
jgi:thiamine-monophosphate kinase